MDINLIIDYLKEKKYVQTVEASQYTVSLERKVFVTDLLRDEENTPRYKAFINAANIKDSILKNLFPLDILQAFVDNLTLWGLKNLKVAVYESEHYAGHYDVFVTLSPQSTMDFVKFNAENKRHV